MIEIDYCHDYGGEIAVNILKCEGPDGNPVPELKYAGRVWEFTGRVNSDLMEAWYRLKPPKD